MYVYMHDFFDTDDKLHITRTWGSAENKKSMAGFTLDLHIVGARRLSNIKV